MIRLTINYGPDCKAARRRAIEDLRDTVGESVFSRIREHAEAGETRRATALAAVHGVTGYSVHALLLEYGPGLQ